MNSYEVMTSIISNKKPSDEDIKKLNQFFMCRWLSNNPKSLYVANFLNRYYKEIPVKNQYYFAKQILAGKIKWIQNPRKSVSEKGIKNLQRYYKVNEDTALKYWDLLPNDKRREFETLYPEE